MINLIKKIFSKEEKVAPESIYLLEKRYQVMKQLELVSNPEDVFHPGLIWMDIEIYSPDMVISKIDTKCEFNECVYHVKKTIYLDRITKTTPFRDYRKNVCGRIRLVNKKYTNLRNDKFELKKEDEINNLEYLKKLDYSFYKPERVEISKESVVNGDLVELTIMIYDPYLGICELEFKIKK